MDIQEYEKLENIIEKEYSIYYELAERIKQIEKFKQIIQKYKEQNDIQ